MADGPAPSRHRRPDQKTGLVVGCVAIGRNEGERLKRCLTSLQLASERVVYVDSGSTDDSLDFAHSIEVEVVDIDDGLPFTAARARNAGFERLVARFPETTHILFIDGDCQLLPDFLPAALETFADDDSTEPGPDGQTGIVTGICKERYPEKSVYNLLCDIEWQGPIGEIDACGGIFVISRKAFETAPGFNPTMIAGEDNEFSYRVRKKGYRVVQIDEDMCLHDANIVRFGQWWRRSVRAGYAYALMTEHQPEFYRGQRLRAIAWGGVLPTLIIASLFLAWPLALVLLGLYPASFLRTRQKFIRAGIAPDAATSHAGFLVLAKFANLKGMLNFWTKRALGRHVGIVEYK